MKLRETGKVDASKIVKDLTKSPRRARKYAVAMKKSTCEEDQEKSKRLAHSRALFMFVEAGLTQAQYEVVRETNPSFYPCYSILKKLKKECYPEIHRVTETCAEVQVQNLMDHTAQRLILHLVEAVEQLSEAEKQSLVLISKWGCDGSQQMQYKMKFENEADSDANIFQSSMVPLQLIYGPERKILWQNPTPSSPRYCRPIRIRFIKETTDVTNEEIDYIKSQITALTKSEVNGFSIKHKMLFTMIDGKVCNAATHTKSTMRCYICGATSLQFNDLEKERPCKKENLEFGLSLLHARIRFFESILHVAYRLPVKKWNVRLTIEEKQAVENKKKEIQDKFREKLGLLVDIPKANFGNTNDGNTSRRFFENFEVSAIITGIDVSLIYRLKVILDTLCCGLKINCEMFERYCQETAKLYVSLYKFYPMSPTLHKVLRHGASVVREAILPIGQLSEEAAEARNKHIRMFRLNYARKFSRVACNVDVFNRLLLTSDPVLTGMRKRKNKKNLSLSADVLNLLLESDVLNLSFDEDDENEE
ncbi:hypothetical protein B5X24_HaOG202615 [Helicoverpa armigera]|uniref:Uncharacterized protein n=1 Tax=Helicoverpa armigera TaxID=29058 RepID=A0A2W1BZ19_HELAM|nr:hypothetical protein B5X24_HaOG202615 [Helicoverpa armigera]